MQNNPRSSLNGLWEVLLKRAHMWVLIILGASDPCTTHVGAVF